MRDLRERSIFFFLFFEVSIKVFLWQQKIWNNIIFNNGRLVTINEWNFYNCSAATKRSGVEIDKLTGRDVHNTLLNGKITKQYDPSFIRYSFSPLLQWACIPRQVVITTLVYWTLSLCHAKPSTVIVLLNLLYYYPHFTDKEIEA